uniref:Uncharacterized protein n=1 Tax=Rhizophora mucronata TaxID=61149 RepID=A0A2P2PM00_RHIMU
MNFTAGFGPSNSLILTVSCTHVDKAI